MTHPENLILNRLADRGPQSIRQLNPEGIRADLHAQDIEHLNRRKLIQLNLDTRLWEITQAGLKCRITNK
jgi:hypothetical protein